MQPESQRSQDISAEGLRIAVVTASFNRAITDGLKSAAVDFLTSHDAQEIKKVDVPGAFELPVVAQALARMQWDAVVCLGAVIKGGTDHYEHVAHRASEGLMRVQLDTGVPVTFGILTVSTLEDAITRSEPGPRNVGRHAAAAAVHAARILRDLRT